MRVDHNNWEKELSALTRSLDRSPGMLQLTTEMEALPPGRAHHIGSIALHFWLENMTAIAAEFPFISFSKLGLKLVHGSTWAMENRTTASGKHSLVFSSLRGQVGPGEKANPCTLLIDVISRGGGAVRFMLGQERSVWDETDICIPCRVGAGNFPMEALVTTITGSAFSRTARGLVEAWNSDRRRGPTGTTSFHR
jgi:hypothetical protein